LLGCLSSFKLALVAIIHILGELCKLYILSARLISVGIFKLLDALDLFPLVAFERGCPHKYSLVPSTCDHEVSFGTEVAAS